MLNLALGSASSEAEQSILKTRAGQRGHAVYGPYEIRDPGSYSVDFKVELAEGSRNRLDRADRPDLNCVVLDVVRNIGADVIATRKVEFAELKQGRNIFRLNFTLTERSALEYRIWTSGAVALNVHEYRRVRRLDLPTGAGYAVEHFMEFPEADADGPEYFKANYELFRSYYDRGFEIAFVEGAPVLSHEGLSFYTRTYDDFNFVGEVFLGNVYNFVTEDPACVIDIGMNIGFSSLQFARKKNVEEIYSFEPFPETYQRAIDNFALNPAIAGKIVPACIGLSDHDWSGDIKVGASEVSGSGTVVADVGDRPVAVTLRDAGAALGPILRKARSQGRRTILKVDCEGSEFAIFRSLEQAQLFPEIDAIMIEWHAMFDDANQSDLIRPLQQAGFLVFDQSPPKGNGFFYAVRMAAR